MTREDEAVARFWKRHRPDRELWYLIGALIIWVGAMVALILGWIPTGGLS